MPGDLNIQNEPCNCPPDQCAMFCDPPAECVNRLDGEVIVQTCPVCAPSQTWHQNDECLRCRSERSRAEGCSSGELSRRDGLGRIASRGADASGGAVMDWRERLARVLWEFDRADMPESSIVHSIDPLDEGWGYLEQADAILSAIDAAGCEIKSR